MTPWFDDFMGACVLEAAGPEGLAFLDCPAHALPLMLLMGAVNFGTREDTCWAREAKPPSSGKPSSCCWG